ncbi:Uncharacterized [Moorella glycerini]|uniref:Uncharacterized protein n=1 Tax=Neomoorella stamsii TaxID=1266720 RepID=A0A9X7J0A9_9FIRM|nr:MULTISPECIES: hypothetical protein [Moorella]PRR69554.1 hypothetical protein MOST_29760 [Moorella stamsii]CEP68792.1 Uncharacterized [Moorella glycerini]
MKKTYIQKMEEICSLTGRLETLVKEIQALTAGGKSNIKIPYAQNSHLEAAGRVEVTGIGCDNTVIRAGEEVRIAGAFRGGENTSGKNVYIREIGTRGGIRTVVWVPRGSVVNVDRCYENVIIMFGSYTYNTRGCEQ